MEPADQLSFLPSKPLVINTFEELAKFSLTGADSDVTSVRICPEISTIEIEIEANGLDGAIPGDQLRTLWELQQDLYKLAAFALHGSADPRLLSSEERRLFEVRVSSRKGSWIGDVLTSDFWGSLFQNLVGKMSGVEIGVTISVCVLIFTGYLAYNSHNKKVEAVKKEETNQKGFEAMVQIVDSFNKKQETKPAELAAQAQNIIDTTAEKVVKRSYNAERITVAGKVFDEEQIQKLKARSKPETNEPETIEGVFIVSELDKNLPDQYSMRLKDLATSLSYNARLIPEAVDGEGTTAMELVNDAFYKETPIQVELSLGKKRNLVVSVSEVTEQE